MFEDLPRHCMDHTGVVSGQSKSLTIGRTRVTVKFMECGPPYWIARPAHGHSCALNQIKWAMSHRLFSSATWSLHHASRHRASANHGRLLKMVLCVAFLRGRLCLMTSFIEWRVRPQVMLGSLLNWRGVLAFAWITLDCESDSIKAIAEKTIGRTRMTVKFMESGPLMWACQYGPQRPVNTRKGFCVYLV